MAAFLINDIVPELQRQETISCSGFRQHCAHSRARDRTCFVAARARDRTTDDASGPSVAAAELPVSVADRDRLEVALAAELIRRIEAGDADDGPWAEQVFVYLKAMVADKLSIDNPKILRAAPQPR